MKNQQVAAILNQIADLLELRQESPYRVAAYREAARQIEGLTEPIEAIDARGELESIPRVGASIAAKIHEFLATGRVAVLDQLAGEVPAGLLSLLQVPGLGPKRALQLYRELGIASIAEQREAAEQHRIHSLRGFGEKSEQNLLRGIRQLLQFTGRLPLGEARVVAERLAAALREAAPAERVEIAGSLRRWRETIGDIDLLAASREPEAVVAAFARLPEVTQVLARGETKATVVTEAGLQVDLRVVPPETFGAALQYFTGSKAHNIKLHTWAEQRGLKISEYGVFDARTGRRLGGATEEEVYACVGLPWIPPELREDEGELEAARDGTLPPLIELEHLRGDLQTHTRWSDGHGTVEEMARAAEALGYDYLAITDHSESLGVAGGLSPVERRAQRAEIDAVNRKVRVPLLVGIEAEIRADGSLDTDDPLLAECDLVVAALHSGIQQPREQVTRRVLAAIRHPRVHLIAHPTNRLLQRRQGADLDFEAIFAAAAATGTALEIDAYPDRLDLDDVHARRAAAVGVPLAIDTDAHHPAHLALMRYGVAVARRGWVPPEAVVNTRPLAEFQAWLGDKRRWALQRREAA